MLKQAENKGTKKKGGKELPFESIYKTDKGGMEFSMDRPLPFLVLHRTPKSGTDLYTDYLGRTEAAYFFTGDLTDDEILRSLKKYIVPLADHFGSFLLVETWVPDAVDTTDIKVYYSEKEPLPIVEHFKKKLEKVRVGASRLSVVTKRNRDISPEGLEPLDLSEFTDNKEIVHIGLEISPNWYKEIGGTYYPVYLRNLRAAISKALKRIFFEFVRLETSFSPAHFEMLGSTKTDKLVFEIDKELADLSTRFQLLELVTPTNIKEAWKQFCEDDFQQNPVFHYEHLPVDPEKIKRQLFKLRIDKVADPTFAFLFRDKRDELAKMVTMLADRERHDFIYSSQLLFGHVDDQTVSTAKALLTAIPSPDTSAQAETDYDVNDESSSIRMGAQEFRERAVKELSILARQGKEINQPIEMTEGRSLRVTNGILQIGKELDIDKRRGEALIQHEIGTHMVTYYNGEAQPFHIFYSGVPGYEQLQEGLAVLAEYIVGGLTNGRLRTLAARVLAVDSLIKGYDFKETFKMLHKKYRFNPYTAYTISMRVFRGGGFTKDAVYLKGLICLLEYLKKGNSIKPLLIGKIRQDFIPIVQELQHRRILNPIKYVPSYLDESYQDKIKQIKKGITVFKMIN